MNYNGYLFLPEAMVSFTVLWKMLSPIKIFNNASMEEIDQFYSVFKANETYNLVLIPSKQDNTDTDNDNNVTLYATSRPQTNEDIIHLQKGYDLADSLIAIAKEWHKHGIPNRDTVVNWLHSKSIVAQKEANQ